jgi:hypothetical protein
MFERVLKILRELVRERCYILTLHAEDEMDEDGLTLYDLEHAVLSGVILERQKDRSTGEWKYRIRGRKLNEEWMEVVVKIGPTNKAVFITAYCL